MHRIRGAVQYQVVGPCQSPDGCGRSWRYGSNGAGIAPLFQPLNLQKHELLGSWVHNAVHRNVF